MREIWNTQRAGLLVGLVAGMVIGAVCMAVTVTASGITILGG